MPTRQEVYAAIDGEREYQVRCWQQSCAKAGISYRPDDTKSVDEWLIFIRGYYADAIREASHQPGGGEELHVVRKLAALCVACMETHGSFYRREDGTSGPFVPGPLVRGQVHTLINTERTYQDNLPDTRTDGSNHTVCGFLCMFDTYLRRAIDGWTNNPGTAEALDNIRKLAGICVHCMEKHGAPHRE